MARLEFCTDEHVPRAYLAALESNGFSVVTAVDERGQSTVDEPLLEWTTSNDRVLVTNDRDFVEIDAKHDHTGLIVYTDQTLTPGEFMQAIRRVDQQFTPDSIRNELIWLSDWT
jgi:predicted nuclease of predicted toxin-antitoxin system